MNEVKIMEQWDYWRKRIACGDKSSAPRDWFESILDEIKQQEDAIREAILYLDKYQNFNKTLNILQKALERKDGR
jgi:uncharacterized membrane protein YfbV (UPF0208 family)